MKYFALEDELVLAKGASPSGQWTVSDGILLWKQDHNIEATRGYIVEFEDDNAPSLWVPSYPVHEGEGPDDDLLTLDSTSTKFVVDILATADLYRVLTQDRLYRSVADWTILAEGKDGSQDWTLHRGILLWREGEHIYAMKGYIVSYRHGSLWTDTWPVDDDGQLIDDPSLYLDADVVAFGDLTPLL